MNFNMKFRRFTRNFGIENLIVYVVITIGVLWVVSWIFPEFPMYKLTFDRTAILHGEVWRVLTCMFALGSPSPIFMVISLYFYFLIGNTLERTWGKEKFTLYYLAGLLMMNIAGFIAGRCDADYFYLSMFCAFAALYPNEEFLMFFIIPVKAKYLAYIDLAFMVLELIIGSFAVKMSIIASLALLAIFFGKNCWSMIEAKARRRKFKSNFDHRND